MKITHYTFFLLLITGVAFAHEEGIYGSFKTGISHPVLGLDYLLAMVSVGVIRHQMGGRAILAAPTTFVGVMALGGILGMINIGLFPVELGIALSVAVLGLAIASNARIYNSLIYAAVGMFGSISYLMVLCCGIMVGIALLYLVEVYLGRSSEKTQFGQTYLL